MNSFDETWSKALGVKTNLSVEARQSLYGNGDDSRGAGGHAAVGDRRAEPARPLRES